LQPVICVNGAEVERISRGVTSKGSTHDDINILRAIVIKISKRDTVTFLNVTGARCGGDILKKFAARVAEHAIGNQHCEVRIPCGEVKMEPAVVVQVAVVAAHREQHSVEVSGGGDVGKSPVTVVVVKFCPRTAAGQSEVIRRDITDVINPVTRNKQVLPPVV